jgi:Tol biopolymer transport system component
VSRRRLKISLSLAIVVAALACAAVALAAGASTDPAGVPTGPRLVYFEAEIVTPKEGSHKRSSTKARFVSVDPKGHDRQTLKTPPAIGGNALPFSWSADGSEYAFRGVSPEDLKKEVAAETTDSDRDHAYVARADGTGARPIAGTDGTDAVVLSPDGRRLAFTQTRLHGPELDPKNPKSIIESLTQGYETKTAWIVPTVGGKPRRLTKWGKGYEAIPTSFSPDGSTLLATIYRPGTKEEVDAIDLATGKLHTLQVEASQASFSPDGSQIAFISYRDHASVPGFDEREGTSEIYVAAADGTGARRITDTPKFEESAPSWDPSGERLAYLRSPGGMFGFLSGRVAESSADGSCTKVLPTPKPRRQRGTMFIGEPTWWPGSERGAGPLSC